MTATSVSITLLATAVIFSALIKGHLAAEHRLDRAASGRFLVAAIVAVLIGFALLIVEFWNFFGRD
jgi:hypothetical protein